MTRYLTTAQKQDAVAQIVAHSADIARATADAIADVAPDLLLRLVRVMHTDILGTAIVDIAAIIDRLYDTHQDLWVDALLHAIYRHANVDCVTDWLPPDTPAGVALAEIDLLTATITKDTP